MKQKNKGVYTENIYKTYGKRPVVQGVDVSVEPGEIVGLLGPNGAGKTTTFYMMVGLIPLTQGKIFLENEDITTLPMHQRARRGIGYLPQEPSVFRRLTVEENILAIAETLPGTKKKHRELVEFYLNELELNKVAKQKAYTLSGGERRRLEISRALVTEPKFLLMDEPFSGVDPISIQEVQNIILSLKKKNIGILITDHNVRETLSIVDRAYLLYDGKILAEGSSEFLVNDPMSRKLYLGSHFQL